MFRKTGKPNRPRSTNPWVDFAFRFEMVTRSEYEALLSGKMSIQKNSPDVGGGLILLNLNHRDTPLKTREKIRLQKGRALQIYIDKLLSLDN